MAEVVGPLPTASAYPAGHPSSVDSVLRPREHPQFSAWATPVYANHVIYGGGLGTLNINLTAETKGRRRGSATWTVSQAHVSDAPINIPATSARVSFLLGRTLSMLSHVITGRISDFSGTRQSEAHAWSLLDSALRVSSLR